MSVEGRGVTGTGKSGSKRIQECEKHGRIKFYVQGKYAVCSECQLTRTRRQKDIDRFGGMREQILKRDNYQCVQCGMTNEEHRKLWGRSITIDHIDGQGRYSEVRNNHPSNLQTLCLRCHGKKDIQRKFL